MTLQERLTAAVEKRLAVAQAATPGPWTLVRHTDPYSGRWWCEVEPGITDTESGALPPSDEDAEHIAANDPARIIRDCRRDLKVLGRHECTTKTIYDEEAVEVQYCDHCGDDFDWPCDDLLDLAEAHEIGVDD